MLAYERSDSPAGIGASDLPAPPGPEARALARALDVSVTLGDILHRRGHVELEATRRFLNPRLAELTPPQRMADRARAAERLAVAVRAGERVCVFGDYDCDGITSAAILSDVVEAVGGSVTTLLASRFAGGYGVSAAAVEKIAGSGARVLVTCDCGSSDHASLVELGRRGVDVIVIDHHLVPAEPLPALAFLNPHRPECGFPYKGLASCGLALSVAAALRAELSVALDLRRWLDLVAIGTIADVAPLDGDNRALVRAGLAQLGASPRPGVRALLELAGIDASEPLTGEDVAFRIAPRVNAPGRLGAPDLALRLLRARSADEARAHAAEVEQLSAERKAQQQKILDEAVEEIERERWAARPAIVVGRQGWNHGVVGIVAGRLAARYALPVIVVGFEGEHGRGSARGPAGARLYDAIEASSDAVDRFGGHQAAAGLELAWSALPALRERFEQAVAAQSPASSPVCDDATLLCPDDDPARVVADLALLEPCGAGNPPPRVAVCGELTSAREVRGGHLKLELELEGGRRIAAFGPGLGARASDLGPRPLVVGRLRRDRWRGGDAVEIKIDQLG
jgi:single-stranded-DNA-specific exonuclease